MPKAKFRHTWTFDGHRYDITANSERELWRKVAEKEAALKSGLLVSRENTPAKKWFAGYLETYKKPSVSEKTYRQLTAYVANYIAPNIGNRKIKDIRAIDLQKILNTCAGQSISQVVKLRNLLCAAFKQARIDRVIVFDPAEGIKLPETMSGTHRPVTDFEREHLTALCQTHRAGLWVLMMLYTGARPDETRKMRWDDVNFENHSIIIHSAKTDFGDRRVPLPNSLYARLHDVSNTGYIFTQPTTGKPHTVTSLRQMWVSFKRALDIQMGAQTFREAVLPETSVVAADLTPYCMRHTYATDLQTAGVPINIAKDLLGHKNIAMTSRVYTHLSETAYGDAAGKIYALDNARTYGKVASFSARD